MGKRIIEINDPKDGKMCAQCFKKPVATVGVHCVGCRNKKRLHSREYHRKKAGIPLDFPLRTRVTYDIYDK